MKKKIYIGADHKGFHLKQDLIQFLRKDNYTVHDLGTDSADIKSDYPDYAQKVAQNVSKSSDSLGILICNTGIGMSIAANRFKNVRAALCSTTEAAISSRAHNDANILVLGAKDISLPDAQKIFSAFISSQFDGGRHSTRLIKIEHLNN